MRCQPVVSYWPLFYPVRAFAHPHIMQHPEYRMSHDRVSAMPRIGDLVSNVVSLLVPNLGCPVRANYGSSTVDRPFREDLPLPTRPPYTAFIGNLAFDVTESEMAVFFGGQEVWRELLP